MANVLILLLATKQISFVLVYLFLKHLNLAVLYLRLFI